MALSRLRLRLGAWFAVAYLAGILVLDLSLYGYLRVQAEHRLTRDLQATGNALGEAVSDELIELADSGLDAAAREAMREWTGPPGAYVVYGETGAILAERGPTEWLAASRSLGTSLGTRDLDLGHDRVIRRVVVQHQTTPAFYVSVSASAEGVEEDNETLALWLGLSVIAILLLGLGGGYVLSKRALAPVDALGDAIAGISPSSLGSRLSVSSPADELDRVRQQFNALLDRLEQAQSENRRFLREAAHQIRTPLTLVMGEASLALERTPEEATGVLRRIQLAAEQMRRRVDDLFLLAEARAGAPPALDAEVELDGLMLEAADAMRVRAHHLGRQLEFGEVAPVTVLGHRGLLLEAVLELLENAVRHGGVDAPVRLALGTAGGEVRLTVASGGPPFALGAHRPDDGEGHGLGLSIVQWIVGLHRGRLELATRDGINQVTLILPVPEN